MGAPHRIEARRENSVLALGFHSGTALSQCRLSQSSMWVAFMWRSTVVYPLH